MNRSIAIVVLACATASPAAAQQGKDFCAPLAPPLTSAATGGREFYKTVERSSMANVVQQLKGEEQAALSKLQDARRELLPKLEAYAAALEDAAYAMQRCAR